MDERVKAILTRVKKPARYAGGEYGAVKKDLSGIDVRIAFCFPDSYEIGMSHLGLKLLYALYNSQDYIWCERSFAPWPDMEAEMRAAGIPLYALESWDPLSEFDHCRMPLLNSRNVTTAMAAAMQATMAATLGALDLRSGSSRP